MWNEVMLWLTQMMSYNEYIPLLIRQLNDAEDVTIASHFVLWKNKTTVEKSSRK